MPYLILWTVYQLAMFYIFVGWIFAVIMLFSKKRRQAFLLKSGIDKLSGAAFSFQVVLCLAETILWWPAYVRVNE